MVWGDLNPPVILLHLNRLLEGRVSAAQGVVFQGKRRKREGSRALSECGRTLCIFTPKKSRGSPRLLTRGRGKVVSSDGSVSGGIIGGVSSGSAPELLLLASTGDASPSFESRKAVTGVNGAALSCIAS